MISSKPTTDELAKYSTWLGEAETALHKLMMGTSAVSVGFNGENVSFTPASIPRLRAYIADLRRALSQPGISNPAVSFRHPVFGRRL